MKKISQVLSLALILTLLLGGSALAEYHETGYPIVDEVTTFTVMNSQASTGGPWGDDMVFFTAMRDLTNIDFTFSNTPANDWNYKMNLALASGELPDIFMSPIGTDNIFTYGVQTGLLLDFSDMIETCMPNLMKMAKKYPEMLKVVRQTDGGIYSFPKLLRTATSGIGLVYVDLDLMHAAGIEKEPETVDEFFDMCMAMKEYKKDDPDFVVFLPQNVANLNQHIELFMMGALGDYVNASFNDDGTGKVFFNSITDQFKRYLEFVHKMYDAGLIHPDFYSMDDATILALIKEGKVGVTTAGTQMPITEHEDGSYSLALLGPLTSEWSSEKKIAAPDVITDSTVAISAACKNPEAILRWYDIFYSEEDVAPGLNCVSPWLGIRGETWDYTDETHEYYYRPQPRDPEMNSTIYIQTYGAPQTYLGLELLAIQQGGTLGNTVKGKDNIKKVLPYTVAQFPLKMLKFTEEEQEIYTNTMVDINAYIDQMKAKFITGIESLDNFDKFVETIQTMGIQDVIDVVQAAYERYNE